MKIEDKHILISGRPLGPLILLGADFLEFSHLSSTNAQCGEEGTRESAPPEGTRESAPPCMKAEREGNLDAGWEDMISRLSDMALSEPSQAQIDR